MSEKFLEHRTRLRVRFSEVDSLRIVWHGNYALYLEEAREGWGREYGLSYLELSAAGYFVPLVKYECDFLLPAVYGDELEVVARFVRNAAAKMEFEYEISRVGTTDVLARGRTVQVFLNESMQMVLAMPEPLRDFYRRWDRGEFIAHG